MVSRVVLAVGAAVGLAVLLTGAAPVEEPDLAGDLRRAVYADVFSGGDGLTHPTAAVVAQVAPLRALLASRPAGTPTPELLTDAPTGTQALRSAGSLLVHAPEGEPFLLATGVLPGDGLRGWWYDPRTGTPIDLGTVLRGADVAFFPPVTGPADAGRDWVLVVDSLDMVPPGGA